MAVPHLLLLNMIGALTPVFLQEELGATKSDIGLVSSAPHWLSLFGSPLLGAAIGRYGLRVVVAVHCCSFIFGSLAYGLMTDWRVAIFTGALQGLEERSPKSADQLLFLLLRFCVSSKFI